MKKLFKTIWLNIALLFAGIEYVFILLKEGKEGEENV